MITINPMEEIIYEATDYCELLMEYEVFINRENIKGQLQMLREADDDKPQNNQANSSESLLTKIIDFFKRIWEKFTGKVKELSLKNSDWLKRYEKQIKEADFNNITITLITYWNSFGNYKIFIDDLTKDTHRLINEAIAVNKERKNIANRMMDSIRETIDKLQNRISIAREEFDNNSNFAKKYSDKDGDLNKGIGNFLRVNDPKIDTSDNNNIVKLTGGEAKAIVAQMYDYCMAYSENVNNINASKKKVDNEISLIERELKNLDEAVNNNQNNAAAQKEAFLMESIQILFEEGQDNNSNNNTSNNSGNNNNNNEPKNGGVQVNQDNKSMSSKELTGSSVDYKSLDAKTLSARNAALKRLQSGFAAVLTIEEEKYTRFMMIMRGIAAKLPKVKVGEVNQNDENKESKDNKDQGTKESYSYLSEMGLPTSKKPVYVILFNNNNAGTSDQIKSITGFPYSHAAISLDTTMNNMYSFSNIPYVNSGLFATGNGFVRESIYSPTYVNNIFFDVFAIMVDNEKYKDIYTTIEKMKAAGPVKYRYNTLGLIDWFFLKTKRTGDYSDIKRKTSFFCSEFVAFLINGQNNMNLSPGELSGLQDIHFLKRFTIPTFKEKTLIKAVNDLERSVNKESYELLNEEFRIPIFSNLFNDDRIKEFVYLLDWKNIKTAFEVKFGNKYNDSVRFTLVEQIIKDIIIPFIDYTKLNLKRDQYTSLVTQWMSNIHAYLISERIQLLVFLNDKNLFNNFVRKFKLQY
jgi:conserved plasmodium protein